MGKPAFRDIERLFHESLAVPPSQRAAFLDAACAGDAALRAAVEELLRHADDQTDTFLASPVEYATAQVGPPAFPPTGPPPGPSRPASPATSCWGSWAGAAWASSTRPGRSAWAAWWR